MPLTPELLAAASSFESDWDERMGGVQTRAFRDVGLYALTRMISLGAEPQAVIDYVRACFELHGLVEDHAEADIPGEAGRS